MQTLPIELNEQILFTKNQALFCGRIVEIREKAIKVDWFWLPIMASAGGVDVYTYGIWIPKSQLITKENTLTCKTWFIKNMKGFNIKKYMLGSDGVTKINI